MLTVKEVGLARETLEEIRKLDLEFYPNNALIDWYLSRYKPWHSAFAAMDDEKMVGYFAAVPVRKELYDAVLNGVLVDDPGVNPNMILKESEYFYAVSIVIRKAYRGRGLGRQMLEMYFSRYPGKKACLLAVSKHGYRLAEHYFSLVKETSVFLFRGLERESKSPPRKRAVSRSLFCPPRSSGAERRAEHFSKTRQRHKNTRPESRFSKQPSGRVFYAVSPQLR